MQYISTISFLNQVTMLMEVPLTKEEPTKAIQALAKGKNPQARMGSWPRSSKHTGAL